MYLNNLRNWRLVDPSGIFRFYTDKDVYFEIVVISYEDPALLCELYRIVERDGNIIRKDRITEKEIPIDHCAQMAHDVNYLLSLNAKNICYND